MANKATRDTWETFTVHECEKFAFQALNGQYISAEDGGGRGLRADKNAIGDWEKFVVSLV